MFSDLVSLLFALIIAYPVMKRILSGMFGRSSQAHAIATLDMATTTSSDFSPTRHDIYHAAFLLQQKLPPEMIPQILNYAEYWLKSTVSSNAMVQISDRRYLNRMSEYICPGITYLSTLPIGEIPHEDINGIELVGKNPVRKVVFRIESQDQGWSNYQEDYGTDRNCWTWFEAVVRDANQQTYQDILRAHYEGGGTRRDVPAAKEGKEIVRNLHALGQWKVYSRTWSVNEEDDETRNWVRSLQRGQIIDLTAWARFAGWQNRIKAASIDVYLAAVR